MVIIILITTQLSCSSNYAGVIGAGLFNGYRNWDSAGLILDMANLTYRPFKNGDTRWTADQQDNGDEDQRGLGCAAFTHLLEAGRSKTLAGQRQGHPWHTQELHIQ